MITITDYMLKIDLKKIKKLSKKADEIFLKPEGEKVLVDLLEAQAEIEKAIDEAKAILEKTALKKNPNFSSIQADKVKVYYREYGAKYYVDENQLDLIPEGLTKKQVKYSVDSKAVEDWVDEHDAMPTGIKEVDRKKSISISLKK